MRSMQAGLTAGGVIVLAIVLCVIFPSVARVVEGAAMDLRRFWWLVLVVGLGLWTVWVIKKRNPGP